MANALVYAAWHMDMLSRVDAALDGRGRSLSRFVPRTRDPRHTEMVGESRHGGARMRWNRVSGVGTDTPTRARDRPGAVSRLAFTARAVFTHALAAPPHPSASRLAVSCGRHSRTWVGQSVSQVAGAAPRSVATWTKESSKASASPCAMMRIGATRHAGQRSRRAEHGAQQTQCPHR
jgi:hypothetical protein